MAKPSFMDILRYLGFIKLFIGPAVEFVEMLKEAFKSKEQKFVDLAIKLLGDVNAAEEAERIVAENIRLLGIGMECIQEGTPPAEVIDCFTEHVNTKVKNKRARNAIYKELALRLSLVNAPEKYRAITQKKLDRLVERTYRQKKEKGFKFKNV